jgi:hypothetical protein
MHLPDLSVSCVPDLQICILCYAEGLLDSRHSLKRAKSKATQIKELLSFLPGQIEALNGLHAHHESETEKGINEVPLASAIAFSASITLFGGTRL